MKTNPGVLLRCLWPSRAAKGLLETQVCFMRVLRFHFCENRGLAFKFSLLFLIYT